MIASILFPVKVHSIIFSSKILTSYTLLSTTNLYNLFIKRCLKAAGHLFSKPVGLITGIDFSLI